MVTLGMEMDSRVIQLSELGDEEFIRLYRCMFCAKAMALIPEDREKKSYGKALDRLGWKIVEKGNKLFHFDHFEGFGVQLFQSLDDDMMVLSFSSALNDRPSSYVAFSQATGWFPCLFDSAKEKGEKVKELVGDKNKNLLFTGHSIGGSFAIFAGLELGVSVLTYNPVDLGLEVVRHVSSEVKGMFGISKRDEFLKYAREQVTNVRVRGECLWRERDLNCVQQRKLGREVRIPVKEKGLSPQQKHDFQYVEDGFKMVAEKKGVTERGRKRFPEEGDKDEVIFSVERGLCRTDGRKG